MSWGENTFLKDPNTLTILPAHEESQAEGIGWYEIQVSREEKSLTVLAFNADGNQAERAEFTWQSPDEDTHIIGCQFFDNEQQVYAGKFEMTRSATEGIRIRGEINGQEAGTLNCSDPNSYRSFGGQNASLPRHWGRLIDPLQTISTSLKFRSTDSNSFGCASCVVLLGAIAAMLVLCFGAGAVPACAGAVAAAVTYYENCFYSFCEEEESG